MSPHIANRIFSPSCLLPVLSTSRRPTRGVLLGFDHKLANNCDVILLLSVSLGPNAVESHDRISFRYLQSERLLCEYIHGPWETETGISLG